MTNTIERGAAERLLRTLNRVLTTVMCVACALMALPAAALAWHTATGSLGTNPLETLVRTPGQWALDFLMGTLTVAPLRHAGVALAKWRAWDYGKRLSDWNWLIRLRRPIGLAAFFYALTHMSIYLSLDVGWSMSEFAGDVRDKPFIAAGLACFVILLPLAATSTNGWMKRLKGRWKQLHYSVYAAGLLAVLHYQFLSKPGVAAPAVYEALLAVLLGSRVVLYVMHKTVLQDRIDGAVPERGAQKSPAAGVDSNSDKIETPDHS